VTRYDKRVQALAIGLSALAGYVDAIGFIELGGFFVSFMSGNSTRLGVGLIERSHDAAIAGGLIATFVVGVIAGSLTGRFAGPHRRPVVLMLVAALLAVGATCSAIGVTPIAVAAMALAMGAENSVFEQGDDVHIGLTYMTGALVRFGQRAASALLGGDRFAWAPYILLWTGLVAGAVAGAATYARVGLAGLWFAAAFAAIFAMIARKL
jgi:uncharacterized membrane protein YoaK (UPF0700 family)